MNKLYFVFLLFFTVATVSAQDASLIGHYPFDGDAGDHSLYHHDATVNGASLSTDRHGTMNKAYQFNLGPQLITAPVPIHSTDELTVTTWINMSNYPGSGAGNSYSNIFTCEGLSFYLQPLTSTSTNLTVSTRPLSGSGPVCVYTFDNTIRPLNTWFHVAFTYKPNGYIKLYVNGQFISDQMAPANLKAGDKVGIGNHFGSPGNINQFLGGIDEVRIYNRELSSTNIMDIYTSESVLVKENQVITFENISKRVGDPDFNLTATAYENPVFTFSGSNDAIATVSPEGLVHLVSAGLIILKVNTTETANYQAGSTEAILSVNPLTGISLVRSQKIKTYPNPLENGQTLHLGMELHNIRVTSTNGTTVLSTDIKNTQIGIENLAPGLYFLRGETVQGQNVHTSFVVR